MEGKRVDYALCHPPERPLIFLEVKKVGNTSGGDRQLFEYAFHKGVPLAILTDGQEWHFFLPAEVGHYQERRVYKIDLLVRELDEIIERFERYLSYDRVCSGEAIEAAKRDYKDVAKHRQIEKTLPYAWRQLLERPDELLLELLAIKVEDICGYKPELEACEEFIVNSIESEEGISNRQRSQIESNTLKRLSPHPTRRSRPIVKNAKIEVNFFGKDLKVNSAREAMTTIFKRLQQRDTTFFNRFISVPHGKKRRYLARDRYELYPDRPDLCELHSIEIEPGWWMGTNYSKGNILQIIQLACEVAGLQFGTDIKVKFT